MKFHSVVADKTVLNADWSIQVTVVAADISPRINMVS
jgi:hypothetical protein